MAESKRKKRGMAGMIVTILVLGFMMTISFSYVLMITGETRATMATEKNARAKTAALAGINFAMVRLQATSTTFVGTTDAEYKKRIYFAFDAKPVNRDKRFAGITPTSDFTMVASSNWLFASIPELIPENEVASSTMFRITSYPATKSAPTNEIEPLFYYVKSQGVYRDIDGGVPTATYSTQFLGKLKINSTERSVTIQSWRQMDLEDCEGPDDAFFTKRKTLFY